MAPRGLEWDFGWTSGGSGQAASPAACARRSHFLSRFPLKSPCSTAGSAGSQPSAQRARCTGNKLFQPSAAGSGSRKMWADACSILDPTAKNIGLAGALVLGPAGGSYSGLVCSMPQSVAGCSRAGTRAEVGADGNSSAALTTKSVKSSAYYL